MSVRRVISDVIGVHVCEPRLFTRDGADHCGSNAFLRCKCGKRTQMHYECMNVTPEVRDYLKREWACGRTTEEEFIGS